MRRIVNLLISLSNGEDSSTTGTEQPCRILVEQVVCVKRVVFLLLRLTVQRSK